MSAGAAAARYLRGRAGARTSPDLGPLPVDSAGCSSASVRHTSRVLHVLTPRDSATVFRTQPSSPGSEHMSKRSGALRSALVAVVAGVVLVTSAGTASAAPTPPPNPTDGQLGEAEAAQQAASAEVGRLAALVASAESELERYSVLAEAAGTAY